MSLFIPSYFAPICQFGMIYQSDNIVFEVHDNFQKQTYRNRCYIYGANGKQLLNIPISHSKNRLKTKTRDVKIEDGSSWQKQHYKSLKSAYNSSPFFEFYEDDLMALFDKNHRFLLDLNLDTFEFINDALELHLNYTKTQEYHDSVDHDYRILTNPKVNINYLSNSYTQVFDDKYGHIENLSILDLLFMEGPNSISFLENVSITL